ncbi:unnamed protein product [Schistosoma margrebowiei]|uniref:Uncharacterized protein n=1 Tax=Schistosoma margrebowiei TaxID=48269 RepID=A0A183N4T8_9TREM|nr:unnamed protein product [Schistosoma margrebowiei]
MVRILDISDLSTHSRPVDQIQFLEPGTLVTDSIDRLVHYDKEDLFPETTSQTSSHSSYSDNDDWNKFDDSSNTSEVPPGRPKPSDCQLEDPNPTENTPSAPPTGSKRRKRILPSRADNSTDSH